MSLATVGWLAFTFGAHILMVNIGVFLALVVPILKWKADNSGDTSLASTARMLFRFHAATYAVAGVLAPLSQSSC